MCHNQGWQNGFKSGGGGKNCLPPSAQPNWHKGNDPWRQAQFPIKHKNLQKAWLPLLILIKKFFRAL